MWPVAVRDASCQAYIIMLAGEYRQRGDYFGDYRQYDYNYDYKSYASKDDLLRYDYNSNYDYRRHGPAYNYSIHYPGIISRWVH